MWLLGLADASTLGWTTVVTNIFTEIRNVGFVCFGGGLVVAGIELLFHRHLDRLGQIMASIGVGGGLIVAGSTAATAALGTAAGATASPFLQHVSLTEAWGDILGVLLYYGLTLTVLGMMWSLGRRYVH